MTEIIQNPNFSDPVEVRAREKLQAQLESGQLRPLPNNKNQVGVFSADAYRKKKLSGEIPYYNPAIVFIRITDQTVDARPDSIVG